ncbi:uncharacterized protein [Hetaerina americana]|uniref:uncharacterized protein n=1 Tax=Hetaerina americana TaxID=62018 RepID=UPI003A7F384B
MAAGFSPSKEEIVELSLVGETNEDHHTGSLKCRINVLEQFAVKACFDKDVEDFQMWTLKRDEGHTGPCLKDIILMYKKCGNANADCGWYCLIVPAEIEESTGNNATATNTSLAGRNHLIPFKIYARLLRDHDFLRKFANIKRVIFYLSSSGHLKSLDDMVRDSESKDYIFHCELLKYHGTSKGWKEINDYVREEVLRQKEDGVKGEKTMKDCDRFTDLAYQELLHKVAFVIINQTPEGLHLLTQRKLEISMGNSGSIQDKFLNVIREILQKRLEGNSSISGSVLRELIECLKLGSVEGPTLLFNLSKPISNFVGREKELMQILYFLGGTSRHWDGPPKKLVLAGLGGVGKSELVREYCRIHFQFMYDNIIWIHAENMEKIESTFKYLAFEKLGIEKMSNGQLKDIGVVVEETFNWLKNRRTLLIYDNVESVSQIRKYLPNCGVGAKINFIITSRMQNWDGFPLILLEHFNPKEAITLLRGSLGHLPIWCEKEGPKLCEALCYFPLALTQAVSYILDQETLAKQEGRTLSNHQYLQVLGSNIEPLLKQCLSVDAEGKHLETTYSVMVHTLKHLEKTAEGQMALTLLNILSYVSPDCIDLDAMCDANPKYGRKFIEKSFAILSKISITSLLGRKGRIHRIVQTVNRLRLRNLGLEVDMIRKAMCFTGSMGVQHKVSVWNYSVEHKSLVKEYFDVPHVITNQLFEQGLYAAALTFSTNALESLKSVLGCSHPAVLKAMRDVSHAYEFFGDIKKATQIMKQCLDAWRNLTGPKQPDYFPVLYDYGNLLATSLNMKAAAIAFEEILLDGPSILGENSDLLHITRAQLLMQEKACNPELEMCESLGELEDRSRERLKAGKGSEGSRQKTIPVIDGVMDSNDEQLNGEPFMLALCHANILFSRGKLQESFKTVLGIRDSMKNHYGESHVFTLKTNAFMAMLLFRMGKINDAEKELDTITLQMGPSCSDNILRVDVESLRSSILVAKGRTKEAIPHILSCCSNKSSESVDEDGLYRVRLTLSLAQTMGKHQFLSSTMKMIYHTLQMHPGKVEIPQFFLDYSIELSLNLSNHGSKRQALVILKEVYGYLKSMMGEIDIETLRVKYNFASIYCSVGDKVKGVKYLMELEATLKMLEAKGDDRVKVLLKEVIHSLKSVARK